jgi:aspartate/methionine/tyrosine aminotransferase
MFLDAANKPQTSAVGHEAVIVTASVSKIYGIGGLRTGWIIAQEDIVKKCLSAKWQASVASPYFSEVVVSAALTKAKNNLIERYKSIARRNFPVVKAWIEKNEDLLDWIPPEGGILCFPKFHAYPKVNSETFGKQLINEKGVLISPGKFFDLDGHFRLTYMNPEDELRAGLESIINVLKTVGNIP